ncbi:ubiquitin carboxyl-terminal hydrolase-domain-containing protein [Aspergillus egyptiacus]|nr:ubiquitin carboxyl-terminal hydrolase-domain-containing protein [Aspergillus egyptiacus]
MSGIHRFLTRRERNGKYIKQSSDESNSLARPHMRDLFTSATTNGNATDQPKRLKALERRISQLGVSGLNEGHFRFALEYMQGDVEKAFEFLLLVEDSIEGIIKGYSPRTKLLGAENREGVTCYLDALLFAMFARLDCFEGILYKDFGDEPRRKLSMLLRLWVNLLRSGKLITTNITKNIQDALAECGWEDAANLHQQDASEAFTFITEKLELPLLTLKMDIYHTGKEDVNDDHRFVNERLLEVAIPEPVDGNTVTLESCLELYFNNRIEVKRYLERHNTLESTKSVDSILKGSSAHVETVELSTPTSSSPTLSPKATPITLTETPLSDRSTYRRNSIIQQKYIPDSDASDPSEHRRGTYRKEVMMPAWQFFSLIPWYTDNSPKNDSQVAAHFSSKRPILGLCLKRYSMLPNGKAIRLDTFVDIPTEIGLPHFIQDDNLEEGGPICGNFKLSLQALVCHRGTSVDSGHYIAIVRGTSAGAQPSSSQGPESSNGDTSPRYWMRFDDLAKERVTLVDIEQALKTESPYLLFYQILPIDEDAAAANLSNENEAASSVASAEAQEQDAPDLSPISQANHLGAGYKSGRPSLEITVADGRVFANGAAEDLADVKYAVADVGLRSVPSTSPRLMPRDYEEGRRSFTFSRRGSRTTRSNPGSRAGSQVSENRVSATFSRFAGRLSKDKISSDAFAFDAEDDETTKSEAPALTIENIKAGEMREKSPRRSRFTDRQKEKGKEKSRERRGRRLERECVVM